MAEKSPKRQILKLNFLKTGNFPKKKEEKNGIATTKSFRNYAKLLLIINHVCFRLEKVTQKKYLEKGIAVRVILILINISLNVIIAFGSAISLFPHLKDLNVCSYLILI